MATTIDPSTAGSDTQQAETVRVRVPSRFPYRTIAMGTIGSTLLMIGALGAAGVLIRDPILGHGPMSWIRYGHGRAIANGLLYIGFALIVWAWVRLGRYALARRIGSGPILAAAGCWMAPLLISPPLFTRDVFSYLGQGAQLLYGLDPYQHGPAELEVLPNVVQNVHQVWQTTPAPYGPLYLLISKGVVAVTGDNLILGVILTRVVLLLGLAMTLWALPRLVRHLGGNLPIALWLAVASPMMVIHLFGGPHNDLMMIGFLTVGVVAALGRKYPVAVVLITVAMLIKATAAIALPFLVWMWAKDLKGSENGVRFKNFVKAGAASVAIFAPVFVAGTWIALGSFNLGWVAGLKAPQLIANWLNPPTGVGEVFYTLVHLVVNVQSSPFVTVARFIGMGVLAVFVARQWWLARVGGTEAILRAAISLLSVSILFPPTLPWYFTWGFVILAAFKWRQRHLAVVVAVSVFLVLVYYPTGEQALYDWWFIAGVVAVSVYAAASLLRPDPLGLVAAFKKQARPAEAPFLAEPAKAEHAE